MGEAIFTWERAVFSRESEKDEDRGCDMHKRFLPQAVIWDEINTQSFSNINLSPTFWDCMQAK